jgi:DNA-binding CsgD family transcriptional regulator
MDDYGENNKDSMAQIIKLMHQIKKDNASKQKWSIQALVFIYISLIIVIMMGLKNVNAEGVAVFAISALIIFITINYTQWKGEKTPAKETMEETNTVADERTNTKVTMTATASTLSPREKQILQLIATGNMNKQIALELGLSPATIRNQISHMMQKLNVSDRTAAVVMAISNGWIDIEISHQQNQRNKFVRESEQLVNAG